MKVIIVLFIYGPLHLIPSRIRWRFDGSKSTPRAPSYIRRRISKSSLSACARIEKSATWRINLKKHFSNASAPSPRALSDAYSPGRGSGECGRDAQAVLSPPSPAFAMITSKISLSLYQCSAFPRDRGCPKFPLFFRRVALVGR